MDLQDRIKERAMEVEVLQNQVNRRREELESEQRALHDLQCQLGLQGTQSMQLTELGQSVAAEDFLDMVNRLQHRLKLQEMKSQALQRDITEANSQIKHKEKLLERLEHETIRIQTITGYKPGSFRRTKWNLTIPEQDMLLQELVYLAKKVRAEERRARDVISHKENCIKKLSAEMKDLDEFEEKLYETQNLLNTKMRELEAVSEEFETLRREHLKADRSISRLERGADDGCLTSLEQDKNFLRSKIYEHVDIRRQQDRAIKVQGFRLEQLQKRADLISNAVADLKWGDEIASRLKGTIAPPDEPVCSLDIEEILPSEEGIDIALYDLLAHDVEAIKNSIDLKDVILSEKEATIEALEEKVESIHTMNEEELFLRSEKVAFFEDEVVALNKAVWADRSRFQNDIALARREKALLEQKYRKLLEKSRESS